MNRGFKGVWIPRDIWLRDDLSCVDKCLLAEIDSLSGYEQGCFASNTHFATFLHVSVPTVSRSVKKLEDLQLIKTTIEKTKTGTRRTIDPLIKMIRPPHQNDETPTDQNDSYSNTGSISNSSSNTPLPPQGETASEGDLFGEPIPEQRGAWKADFEIWYSAYPKKKSKQEAVDAWKKMSKQPDFPGLSALVSILEVHKRCDQWQRGVIPNPATWLNKKRWMDEVTIVETEEERKSRLLKEYRDA